MRRALAALVLAGGVLVLFVTAAQTPRRYSFYSRALLASPLRAAPRVRFEIPRSSCALSWTRRLAEATCESRGRDPRFPLALIRRPVTLLRVLIPSTRHWHCFAQSSLIVAPGLRSRVVLCIAGNKRTIFLNG
jgi:hypothetical protein